MRSSAGGDAGGKIREGTHAARFSQSRLTAGELKEGLQPRAGRPERAIVVGMRTLVVLAVIAGALAVGSVADAGSSGSAPVATLKTNAFGKVLSRRDGQALYYWRVEKQAGGRVRCTGSCAAAWPPLLVRSAAAVPKRVVGITGVFGVVRRPDGKLQVTRNRLPLYTYAHEGPKQVLCNDVDGWFVVRI
jgi:predicted lipoprotein with Yx(FWY)xxD motif